MYPATVHSINRYLPANQKQQLIKDLINTSRRWYSVTVHHKVSSTVGPCELNNGLFYWTRLIISSFCSYSKLPQKVQPFDAFGAHCGERHIKTRSHSLSLCGRVCSAAWLWCWVTPERCILLFQCKGRHQATSALNKLSLLFPHDS